MTASETQTIIDYHQKKPAQKIIQSGIYATILAAPTRSGKGVSSIYRIEKAKKALPEIENSITTGSDKCKFS